MKEVNAVIFDLGGVLLNLDLSHSKTKMDVLGLPDGLAYGNIFEQYQLGNISTDRFFSYLQSLCDKWTERQEIIDAWNSCLSDMPEYKLQYVLQLRKRGIKTYLLSNTNEAHWNHIRTNIFPRPAEDYFDAIYLSQELHLAKPDKAIYEVVLSHIGLQADECLFLDDTEENIEAASSLGIRTYRTPVRYDWRNDVSGIICC